MVPKRVIDRLTSNLRRLLPILQQQRTREVSEADTVTLVKDLLCDVFGYDKWAELTADVAIRGQIVLHTATGGCRDTIRHEDMVRSRSRV